MDTTEYAESKYLTADIVKNSPSRIGIITSEAKSEQTDFGEKLQCNVQIDGKTKIWRLNMDSVKNLHRISTNSKDWILTKVNFTLVSAKGKDVIIGVAILPIVENLG